MRRLRRRILLGMMWTRLQPGHAEPVQPFADGAFVNDDYEALGQLVTQVDAAPAHDLVDRRVQAGLD